MESQQKIEYIINDMMPKKECDYIKCRNIYVYINDICDNMNSESIKTQKFEDLCEKVKRNWRQCMDEYLQCRRTRYKSYF